ncbi:MAG: hypothetical protein ACOVJ8_04625 [Sediminibacterium sp.]
MATLNTILSIAESVGIDDQRFIGQMMSRNQRIATSEIIGVQPFGFEMKPMNYLLYSQNRPLLSSLRTADREFEQYLNFGVTGWANYIYYQGDMTSAEISACQYQTSSANKTIVLGSLPTMGATEYIVKTGDFLQIDRYSYIATADVQRGGSSTVNIPVHRTIMTTLASPMNAVIAQYGTTQSIGGNTYTGVTFPVILQSYPTYTLIPMTDDSFIQWSGTFKAIEAVL